MNWKRFRGQFVFLLDLTIYAAASLLLFLLGSSETGFHGWEFVRHLLLMGVCISVYQAVFRTYNSLWRYAETREYLMLLASMSCALGTDLLIAAVLRIGPAWMLHTVASTSLALVLMLLMRFLYRVYRTHRTGRSRQGRNYLAIIGAGTAGVSLLREITANADSPYIPYCFFDDSAEKIGKKIQGIPILGPISELIPLLENTPVSVIILAIPTLSAARRAEILRLCSHTSCKVRILPDTFLMLKNSTTFTANVRSVEIEDLLGRESVHLNNPVIRSFIADKTVMVTGGGGSIGSELCRQIAEHRPKRLVVVDIAENSTYDLQNDLLHRYGADFPLSVEIASVRDRDKVNELFRRYRPQLVFHAAAHKHVPLMENCPEEAVKNNVFGTFHVADAAKAFHAEKFVLISTDKAVNPTNVMGATKQLCEKILHALRVNSDTCFAAVRFGNVLGSNGSVVPLFKKQIAHGGPVTVTDKRVVRFFMTIPEAVQLILQAGSMAHSGEVYVLDMGEPVRIYDLAENLIRLSGLTPQVDIPIVEIGLRPGEKLYEELLTSNGALSRTANKKIFVEMQPSIDPAQMFQGMARLRQALDAHDRAALLAALHQLVPTFEDPDVVNRRAIEQAEKRSTPNIPAQPVQGGNRA